MKQPSLTKSTKRNAGYPQLVTVISAINIQMVTRVATAANQALVLRNWMVGAYIVEFEQNGADRAKYGERLLERLAEDLKAKGVKGLIERTLRDCRAFFLMYPQIRGSLPPEFGVMLPARTDISIRGSVAPELPTPLSNAEMVQLSWTKLQELIRIDDPWKRAFHLSASSYAATKMGSKSNSPLRAWIRSSLFPATWMLSQVLIN